MTYLLDTCAISELRKPQPDPGLAGFLAHTHSDRLYLSAITIGEITKGIECLADGRRKHDLGAWLAHLLAAYGNQILHVDADTAQIWGKLTAQAQARGVIIPALDGLIAATALRHDLIVVTRNIADFQATGARVENPWASRPRA